MINSVGAKVEYSSKTGTVIVRGLQPFVVKKLAVIRAHPSSSIEEILESFVHLEKLCYRKSAKILVRQHQQHPDKVLVSVVNGKRAQQAVNGMAKRGFTATLPNASSGALADGVFLKEGDVLTASFGSNVRVKSASASSASSRGSSSDTEGVHQSSPTTSKSDNEIAFFNNFNGTKEFDLEIVDPFLQKEYEDYKGVISINKKSPTKKFVSGNEESTEEIIGKVPVGIPKAAAGVGQQTQQQKPENPPRHNPQQRKNQRLTRRPRVELIPTADDPTTLDLLKDVAIFVGADWRMLATRLDLPTPTVALIEKRHMKPRDILFDVLVTWAARQPVHRVRKRCHVRSLGDDC